MLMQLKITFARSLIKEQEYILLFEAKKKYYRAANFKNVAAFDEKDSVAVDKMSIRDAGFIQYLHTHTKGKQVFTIQEKCARLIPASVVNAKAEKSMRQRASNFMAYFREKGVEKQIKISKVENVIPYNGFSYYKITYQGEVPPGLLKAYRQLNELNNEDPRKKDKKARMKISNLFKK